MPTTLITVIGRGEAAQTAGADPYQRTAYRTDAGDRVATFFGQLLVAEQQPDHVHILGTVGSTWRALAWDAGDLDLGVHLERVETQGGPSSDLLDRLARCLEAAWTTANGARQVTCHLVDERDHVGLFATAYRLIPERDTCLLDLTHGYRDMPMLLLAAAQVKAAFHPGLLTRTRLWYGRLTANAASPERPARSGPGLARGSAHRLDTLEQTLALANGAAAFCRSLDPRPLLDALHQPSNKLREALDHLADILLTHDFTQLTIVPQQVLDHLERWDHDPGNVLHDEIARTLRPLAAGGLARRLYALATWADANGHYALAAQAAYECLTRCATNDVGADASHAITAFLTSRAEHRQVLGDDLRRARNRTAHGSDSAKRNDRIDVPATLRRALPLLKTLLP